MKYQIEIINEETIVVHFDRDIEFDIPIESAGELPDFLEEAVFMGSKDGLNSLGETLTAITGVANVIIDTYKVTIIKARLVGHWDNILESALCAILLFLDPEGEMIEVTPPIHSNKAGDGEQQKDKNIKKKEREKISFKPFIKTLKYE